MYPEAGGSSSLRAPRVQRVLVVLRRLGADAHLRGDDRHERVLRPALPRRPVLGRAQALARATSSSPCITIAVLGAINIVGVKESTGVNVLLAVVDFLTQVLLVLIGVFLVFDPEVLIDNVHFGVAPTWTNFVLAIPIGMLAYTGIETVSNMSEEAKDESHDDPDGDRARAPGRVRDLLHAARRRALRAAGRVRRTASTRRCSACPDEEGGSAGDPVLGVVRAMDLGVLQQPAELYVGLLAATILFLATNAGLIGISPARLLDGHPPPAARRAAAAAPASTARRGSASSSSRASRSWSRCPARRRSWAASTPSARC